MKKCRGCGEIKSTAEFHRSGYTKKDGTQSISTKCKLCNNKKCRLYHYRNREILLPKIREYARKHKDVRTVQNKQHRVWRDYGLTLEDLQQMILTQNNKCAICFREFDHGQRKAWVNIDHDHSTGKVHGLLCWSCNAGLGSFQDNTTNLMKAIEYLNKNQ